MRACGSGAAKPGATAGRSAWRGECVRAQTAQLTGPATLGPGKQPPGARAVAALHPAQARTIAMEPLATGSTGNSLVDGPHSSAAGEAQRFRGCYLSPVPTAAALRGGAGRSVHARTIQVDECHKLVQAGEVLHAR